jgi:hypothetical protein
MRYYTLDAKRRLVPMRADGPENLLRWVDEMARTDRIVARGYPGPGIEVCTDFLGIAINLQGPPEVFETAVFLVRPGGDPGPTGRGECTMIGRCATWEEAKEMHAETMCEYARSTRS